MTMKRLIFACFFLIVPVMLAGTVSTNSIADDSPAVIKAVAPMNYPPLASTAIISGKVKVEVTIDPVGNVKSARIIEGHPLLRDVSKQAALRWRFVPSKEGNKERKAQ